MAQTLLVLGEVIAMLGVVGVSTDKIEKFRKQAEFAMSHKARGQAPDSTIDSVTVSSGYGTAGGGHVELTLNEQLTQMHPGKAREIGLMLLEAAEAAASDEIFVKFMRDKIGVDPNQAGVMLIELRNIRQGTRGVSWPS